MRHRIRSRSPAARAARASAGSSGCPGAARAPRSSRRSRRSVARTRSHLLRELVRALDRAPYLVALLVEPAIPARQHRRGDRDFGRRELRALAIARATRAERAAGERAVLRATKVDRAAFARRQPIRRDALQQGWILPRAGVPRRVARHLVDVVHDLLA